MNKKNPNCECPLNEQHIFKHPRRIKQQSCECPLNVQHIFKHPRRRKPVPPDVAEIIKALSMADYIDSCQKMKKPFRPPKFKTKPFRPQHFKETCVPMKPSMHTRLRYIGHCPLEPASFVGTSRATVSRYTPRSRWSSQESLDSGPSIKKTVSRMSERNRRRVRYNDRLTAGDILLPAPCTTIRHSTSSKSILSVPSPKTSGEVIQAQRAAVKPTVLRPPVPAKSGHELFKPHSGIILNRDKDFVPDVVHMPGSVYGLKRPNKPKPCYKGGVCLKKGCPKKKCRKYAAQLKRRKLMAMRLKRQGCSKILLGVTDGKLRGRKPKRRSDEPDDDPCSLDEIPRPEHVRIPANLKKGTLQTHSLTVVRCTKDKKPNIHYGILTGTFNMYDAKFGPRSRGRQALPISVMAFCLAFHYHPKQWTMKLIDNLMDAGDVWYLQLLDKVHNHSSVQGICEVLPFGKKQIMVLNGKRMQVLLCEPDIVGYTMSLDPTVYNLCRGLKAFFQENRAGILLSRVLKLVIWKDNVCYYIFDPAGRDSRAYSNFANGRAALMNVKDVESVAQVLLARSILENQKFLLASIKILKMADEKCDEDFESDKELTQAEKAMMGYRILNAQCAIVNANMHLGNRCFEEAKYRQALPIAVVAMTYAKISPPNTWFSKTLDKIIRLGNKLYVDCTDPKVLIDITIDNIPNEIMIGPYACEIIIYRERAKGQLFTTKECIFNIKSGLEDFFSQEYNSAILEFNHYALAVWRQKDMFYMFDPYPRTSDGLRTLEPGKGCCMMLLDPETLAKAFTDNWNYLPPTTQFYLHAFKVLKLKKKNPKIQLYCRLSVDDFPAGKKKKRKVLPMSKAHGDGIGDQAVFSKEEDVDPKNPGNPIDEEQMGDIISLVDSIDEDYVPPVPMRYKKPVFEPMEMKVVNLDSPTVSVTQMVPPWPKPRDKTNEPIEPDPDPEPTPPPTPQPIMPPEGAEEEEKAEEEEDEEMREERLRKKAEEEEARRKAEALPSPLPPPPPSPQSEPDEPPLAEPLREEVQAEIEDELQTKEPIKVDRRVLLTEDAQRRFKLRKIRNKISPPLMEDEIEVTAEQELEKPTNFRDLPDSSQIIRGSSTVTKPTEQATIDKLPFGAIMAIVTSYKYSIHSWTPAIVDFVVMTALKLYDAKHQKFQMAPAHVIPKIALGHQAYHAHIDVVDEGASWQLEKILEQRFFTKYDRGMITTSAYSCAIFKKNGLYYLFDGTPCTAMGLREVSRDSKGKACFLRFRTVHELANRINYNKDGRAPDQQFIISRILVRKLLKEPRTRLPEDYDYATRQPKSLKSKEVMLESEKSAEKRRLDVKEKKSQPESGYQLVDGIYRIGGTTALTRAAGTIKACHFVCLIAMLMATMHPVKKWERIMIDICIEKGLEIYGKATNLNPCEKRVIKNVILDGKFINVNIKKILVVNENTEKKLEQYLKAVLRRLRYVIIRYPTCNMVICQTEGQYHLFDPYPPPRETAQDVVEKGKKDTKKDPKKDKKKETVEPVKNEQDYTKVATWTLYRTIEGVICRIKKMVPGKQSDTPEFYTFELTSVKSAPRHAALYYRLSPLFKPDVNPNTPYLKTRKQRLSVVDEKMYWLSICTIPWSRMNAENDLGFARKTPQTMWNAWDIEFPGDLYSLWGSIHPLDYKFDEELRGKQYLATSVLAIGMTRACQISAWTSSFLDGIVVGGNSYHKQCIKKIGSKPNYEIGLTDLESKFDGMFPFVFSFKFEKIIFGFVYNIYPDRFNLSKALVYFFENDKNEAGILTSPGKNLAFGKIGYSYFMFDCQSFGAPIFSPGQGAAYILKCESLNRLIHCMTLTLNIRTHGQQFHLYSAAVTVGEKPYERRSSKKDAPKPTTTDTEKTEPDKVVDKTESGKISPDKEK